MNAETTTGTVQWFDPKKGYGFIRVNKDGINAAMVHYTDIISDAPFKELFEGDLCEFTLDKNGDKFKARRVSVLTRAKRREYAHHD